MIENILNFILFIFNFTIGFFVHVWIIPQIFFSLFVNFPLAINKVFKKEVKFSAILWSLASPMLYILIFLIILIISGKFFPKFYNYLLFNDGIQLSRILACIGIIGSIISPKGRRDIKKDSDEFFETFKKDSVEEEYDNSEIKNKIIYEIPFWKFLLLFFVTSGVYFFYWVYINWKNIQTNIDNTISPFWRTLVLLIPLLNLYYLWDFFERFKKEANLAGGKFIYNSIILVIFFQIFWHFDVNDFSKNISNKELINFIVFSSLPFLLLIPYNAQTYLYRNKFNAKVKNDFSPVEVLFLIGGLLFIFLILMF